MNWKFWTYSIVIFVAGLLVGGVVSMRYQNNRIEKAELKLDDANRVIDSVSVANIEQKKIFEKELNRYGSIIQGYRERLNIREDEFKNDTIVPDDDELIRRARIVTGNND